MAAKRHSKSPVAWPGGKYRLAPAIIDLFPPHDVYVETCGGGGHVLFAKHPSGNEVYNDLDGGPTNFFRVTQDETTCALLLKRLAATAYSREEYYTCCQTWAQQKDPIERARRWFVATRMSFRSMIGKGWVCSTGPSTGSVPQFVSAWHHAQMLIHEAQVRLSAVQIDNRDVLRVLDIYDSPTTLFYIDPPYDPATWCGNFYRHEMTQGDHAKLVDRILKLKGMAIVSGYATDLYKPLEAAGYERVELDHSCTIGHSCSAKSKTQGTQRTECIWHKPVKPTPRRSRGVRLMEATQIHASFMDEAELSAV